MKPLDLLGLDLSGRALIEASAGTGKTYAIATLYLRLVAELGLSVGNVLTVTFTERATAELRTRIRERLSAGLDAVVSRRASDPLLVRWLAQAPALAEQRLRKALAELDEAAIYTIHGLCHRILKERAFEGGAAFDAELTDDGQALLLDVVQDFFSAHLSSASPLVADYLIEEGFTPRRVMPLVRVALSQPDLVLLSDAPCGVDPSMAYNEAFARCRRAFFEHQEQVAAVLLGSEALNRNRYRKTSAEQWLVAIARYFAPEQPNRLYREDLNERVDKLTCEALAEGTKTGKLTPTHSFFEACSALAQAKSRFEPLWSCTCAELIDFSRRELSSSKASRLVMTFDDMLQDVDNALADPARREIFALAVRQRFRAVLIDEFQDTDRLQQRVFGGIFGDSEAPCFLIGDPKQSIYAFRGADVFAYLDAASEIGEARYTLNVNYRSDPSLIRALNALFGRCPAPFAKSQIRYVNVLPRPGAADALRGGLAPFEIAFVERDSSMEAGKVISKGWLGPRLPRWIASKIARELDGEARIDKGSGPRPLAASDIAVLVRTNAQAEQMQAALSHAGVPAVLYSGASVFASPEAADLYHVLAAVAEPTMANIRAALATALFGLCAAEIDQLSRDDAVLERWVLQFQQLGTIWCERGFPSLYRVLKGLETRTGEQVLFRLLSEPQGERRAANIGHLFELLHARAREDHLGSRALVDWLAGQIAESDLATAESELRLEREGSAVTVATIHKSKGLEFEIVYCPYVWEGDFASRALGPLVFHDEARDNSACLDLSKTPQEGHLAQHEKEAEAENARLLYVALTRARHRVVVVFGAMRGAACSHLARLMYATPHGCDEGELAERLAAMTDDELRDGLLPFIDASASGEKEPSVRVVALPQESATRLEENNALCRPRLSARVLARRVRAAWRCSSFSGLTSHHGASFAKDERDLDLASSARPDGERQEPPEIVLAGLPRGALTGSLLHRVLELYDFQAPRSELAQIVEQELALHRFDPAWRTPIARQLETSLEARIASGLQLCELGVDQRLRELKFVLPTARFSARDLSDLLCASGAAPLYLDYAERLRGHDFDLQGFLKGYIDLVFEWQGRWYIADYKSNFLGDRYADYASERLVPEMIERDYVLQYLFYAAALHRYLGLRVPGYDYGIHFGGVFYLFLRGMDAKSGENGVFFDLPPRELVCGLSALFDGTFSPKDGR